MKAFVILAALVIAVNAADDYCYKNINSICEPSSPRDKNTLENCTAKYGGIETVVLDIQKYANTHIIHSFEYLLMSSHFANYETNRAGFEKLFLKKSDAAWEDGIDLIKYLGKRGVAHNFEAREEMQTPEVTVLNNGAGTASTSTSKPMYQTSELESLAKAIDIEKSLAKKAFHIHEAAIRHHAGYHDPEVSSFIENKFVHKHADNIRELTGHVADLSKLLSGNDRSIAMYLFDEYLQKA